MRNAQLPVLGKTRHPAQYGARKQPAFPLSSVQCQEVTGATQRQIQWMDEKGIVSPLRNGRNRKYERIDALCVLLWLELRRRGIGPSAVRSILVRVRAYQRQKGLADLRFMICLPNGKCVFHFDTKVTLAAIANCGLCLLVDVERLREKLL